MRMRSICSIRKKRNVNLRSDENDRKIRKNTPKIPIIKIISALCNNQTAEDKYTKLWREYWKGNARNFSLIKELDDGG